ncbi:hypothetical protein [Gordonia terrae]|uniref:hypothetical protein n=1 Tax=Gordonia terrae TaxID=2055 RepID=UPI003F6BDE5E
MTLRRMCAAMAAIGAIAIVGGAAMLWAPGVAVMIAGLLTIVGSVVLYDPSGRR